MKDIRLGIIFAGCFATAIVSLTFAKPSIPRDATAVYVENNCVAVLTEAHEEKRPLMSGGGPMWPVVNGEEIVQVPEQTLKIKCK
jgi:hypothetical protein